jgi:hypothetical protein
MASRLFSYILIQTPAGALPAAFSAPRARDRGPAFTEAHRSAFLFLRFHLFKAASSTCFHRVLTDDQQVFNIFNRVFNSAFILHVVQPDFRQKWRIEANAIV